MRTRSDETEKETGGPFRSAKTAQYLVITSSAISTKVVKSVLTYYITVVLRPQGQFSSLAQDFEAISTFYMEYF